jgi:signal transduction histidine kinase
VISALELDRRFAHAAQALGYLLVGAPMAVLAVPALAALLVGALFSVIAVGLPLLLAGAWTCRWLVRLDRRAANKFLDAHIAPVPGGPGTAGSPWRRSLVLLSDRTLWRTVAQLAIRSLLAAGTLAIFAVTALFLSAVVQLGVDGIGGGDRLDYLGPWTFGPALGIILCALAPACAVLVLATLDSARGMLRANARAILAPRTAPGAPVGEMLAESLGDRSVSILYWLPERNGYVDETGRSVEVPASGSGRAWTAVERDGQRVAAIIHDAALDTSNELVQAAATASSMALDNERLKADLRARLEELRISRQRIVEASDAARRRIERDLHDGAQQQLVALALQLRLLKSRLDDPRAGRLVDELSEQLARALAELRELARGIHPAILTDRGLSPAIDALAGRSTVPVVSRVAIDGRLPGSIEAAVYFLVAEALTNVAKYAHASSVRIDVRREGDAVLVEVADDGVGGAHLSTGSGLRGLQDRLAVLGGSLVIDSPVGGGTHVLAIIPDGAPRPAPGELLA